MLAYENRTPEVTIVKVNTVNIRHTQIANLTGCNQLGICSIHQGSICGAYSRGHTATVVVICSLSTHSKTRRSINALLRITTSPQRKHKILVNHVKGKVNVLFRVQISM